MAVFRLAEGGPEKTEVLAVQQMLESSGIRTVLVDDGPLANLAGEIRVLRNERFGGEPNAGRMP